MPGRRRRGGFGISRDITECKEVEAAHLSQAIQAARLKGAHTIVTGISGGVAEAVVDLSLDWGGIEALADPQTGLRMALDGMVVQIGIR